MRWTTPITLTDRWINQLSTQFGQLDTIKLSRCDELKTFKVSNHTSLKRVELRCCNGLEIIEIGAINLESFTYWGKPERKEGSVSVYISACKHLKHLELGGGGIPKHLLHEQLSELFELEKLKLFLRYFHERVEINLQHLMSLSIINPSSADIKINAPRLVSFDYSGKLSPLYPIHHETTLNDARLGFYPDGFPDISYFLNSFEFLLHLGPCKELTLALERNEALIFPEDLRKRLFSPLVDLKHMIVELQESATISTELVDSLLWLSPNLETMVFDSSELEQTVLSIKFEYERRTMNKEDICCLALPTEFSSLENVEMEESFGSVDEKDNLFKYFKGKAKSVHWKCDYL